MTLALDFAPSEPIPAPARPLALCPQPGARPSERPAGSVPTTVAGVYVLRAPVAQAAPVRLTHRGVLVLALAVAALGAALVWVAALSAPVDSVAPATGSGPAAVLVQPGDTLWSIATRVAPNHDPRAEVAVLQRLNHLSGVDLVPGQSLRLH